MDNFEQPGIPYDQLTPEQRAKVAALFPDERHGFDRYTYALDAEGHVCGWRYWIPSQAAIAMMIQIVTGK